MIQHLEASAKFNEQCWNFSTSWMALIRGGTSKLSALFYLAVNLEIAYVMNPFLLIPITKEIIPAMPYIKNNSTSLYPMASSVQWLMKNCALPIMDTVIRETLHVHPPIHSMLRHICDDVPVPAMISAPSKDGVYVAPWSRLSRCQPDGPSCMEGRQWMDPLPLERSPRRCSAGVQHADEHGEKIDYGLVLSARERRALISHLVLGNIGGLANKWVISLYASSGLVFTTRFLSSHTSSWVPSLPPTFAIRN